MMTWATGSGVIGPEAARHTEEAIVELEERLRRLGMQDEKVIESLFATGLDNIEASGLDPKTHALVRLGALLALGAAPVSFQCDVEAALAAGATDDEIVGAQIAVAPVIGFARVVSATPQVALPMGYDIEAALEAVDRDQR
jgi:alkylhydroperoxidase/carboxymuconolactone decarboxylase family protein YurZ